MIKLFSLKQQNKDDVPGRGNNTKKASAAQLRITKGATDFDRDNNLNFYLFYLIIWIYNFVQI